MCRYRLLPSPAQEAVLRDHCAHARFTWNLAVEQHSHWHPGRTSAPGYLEQCRQLTQARAEHAWLRQGSQMVQQQARPACEPRTSTAAPPGVVAGIPRRQAGEDAKYISHHLEASAEMTKITGFDTFDVRFPPRARWPGPMR
jgi:hypothetical protein